MIMNGLFVCYLRERTKKSIKVKIGLDRKENLSIMRIQFQGVQVKILTNWTF